MGIESVGTVGVMLSLIIFALVVITVLLQNPLFISLLQLLIYFITLSLLAYANALSILPGAIHASGKPNKHDGSLNTNNGV